MTLIDPKKWLTKHPVHKERAAVISAGPYLDYKKVKEFTIENPDVKIVTVKHAYPKLLEHDILLPRRNMVAHVYDDEIGLDRWLP